MTSHCCACPCLALKRLSCLPQLYSFKSAAALLRSAPLLAHALQWSLWPIPPLSHWCKRTGALQHESLIFQTATCGDIIITVYSEGKRGWKKTNKKNWKEKKGCSKVSLVTRTIRKGSCIIREICEKPENQCLPEYVWRDVLQLVVNAFSFGCTFCSFC